MSRLCFAILCTTAAAWPWPWENPNKTTTPPPSAVNAFETGVAEALGFTDVVSCYGGSRTGVEDLWEAAEDYRRGGYVSKAEALAKFGEGIHGVVSALEPCSSGMTDASKYKKLIRYLADPRYYTETNALTLALNIAEDRHELAEAVTSWQKGDFETAGYKLVDAVLDVLLHPGIPSGNGTEAAQIALGLGEGFASDIDLKCFTDLSVEVPALIGGVIDVVTVVKIVGGLESLFHGLEGLVPAYKTCLSDRPRIMTLLREFKDFKHPRELATQMLANLKANGLDLSLEAASAVLAYKGQEWRQFGLALGKMLAKMIMPKLEKVPAAVVV